MSENELSVIVNVIEVPRPDISIASPTISVVKVQVSGPPGPVGASSKWHHGDGPPAGTLGVNFDLYLDDLTDDVYYRQSNIWGIIANIKGAPGTNGQDGAAGPAGPAGANGTNGTNGTNGVDGATWRSGPGAPSNLTGVDGDFWFNETNGVVYKKVSGAYSAIADLSGPAGTNGSNGTDGFSFLSGHGAPSNSLGNNGDTYIDEDTGNLYGPKASGVWGSVQGNLRGPAGTNGTNGTNGVDGATTGNKYIYNSSTSNADPGSGKFSLNNATLTSATRLNISETDGDGNDISGLIAAIDDQSTTTNRAIARMRNASGTKGVAFFVTSALTDNSTWDNCTISPIAAWGSFTNGEQFYFSWEPAGPKGDTGAAGTNGAAGAAGANGGNKFTFSTGTSGDPTSGKFLFNNATFTSATQWNVSETDADSASIASMLAAIDDVSTSTNRAVITYKTADGTKGFSFYVTSAITDNGAYDSFTISPIASWGSPANGDTLYMWWAPSGPKGDTGATGASGSGGGGATVANYTYSTNTTDSDPTSGHVKFANGGFAANGQTTMYIDPIDKDGNDLTSMFNAISINYLLPRMISIYDTTSALNDRLFGRITSITAASGYYKLGIDWLILTDTTPPFVDASTVTIIFHAPSRDVYLPPMGFATANDDAICGIPNFQTQKFVTFSPTANTSYVTFFKTEQPLYIHAICFNVATAGTTGNTRLSIYRAIQRTGDGLIMGKVFIDGGVITNALASQGRKLVSPATILPPGYWALLVSIATFGGSPVINALSGSYSNGENMVNQSASGQTMATLLDYNGQNIATSAADINAAVTNVTTASLPSGTTLDTMFRSLGYLTYKAIG